MSPQRPMLRHSFIKLFVGGEANHVLRLPKGVEERLHVGSTRQLLLNDYYGRQWEVMVERPKTGGDMSITSGWTQFVLDTGLAPNEVLIFIEDKSHNYTVEVYDAVGGVRELMTPPPPDGALHGATAFIVSMLNAHCMNEHRGHPRIPSEFVTRYPGLESPMVLYTRRDYPSCEVTLESIDGDLCLTDGWEKFASDNDIKPFDRISFREVTALCGVWLVTVYAVGGTPKYSYIPRSGEGGHRVGEGEAAGAHPTVYRFVKRLKDYETTHTYLEIPKKFVVQADIMAPTEVELENKEGEIWHALIGERPNKKSNRFYITDGWSNFARANKLAMGKHVLFSMTEELKTVIKVEILNRREGEELMSTAERGGYIPVYI